MLEVNCPCSIPVLLWLFSAALHR